MKVVPGSSTKGDSQLIQFMASHRICHYSNWGRSGYMTPYWISMPYWINSFSVVIVSLQWYDGKIIDGRYVFELIKMIWWHPYSYYWPSGATEYHIVIRVLHFHLIGSIALSHKVIVEIEWGFSIPVANVPAQIHCSTAVSGYVASRLGNDVRVLFHVPLPYIYGICTW